MTDFQEEWVLFREIKKSNKYFKKGDILTVSDYGRVKCNGEFYKCGICNDYYYLCGIPLHRIIAEKFIPGWDPNKEVDHKDRNHLNNMVTNLLVCDHKTNMNNPLTIQYRETHKSGSPQKLVLQYTLDNKFVAEYVSTNEAYRQTKISQSHIVDCCKYRRKSAGGYIWKYKEE